MRGTPFNRRRRKVFPSGRHGRMEKPSLRSKIPVKGLRPLPRHAFLTPSLRRRMLVRGRIRAVDLLPNPKGHGRVDLHRQSNRGGINVYDPTSPLPTALLLSLMQIALKRFRRHHLEVRFLTLTTSVFPPSFSNAKTANADIPLTVYRSAARSISQKDNLSRRVSGGLSRFVVGEQHVVIVALSAWQNFRPGRPQLPHPPAVEPRGS